MKRYEEGKLHALNQNLEDYQEGYLVRIIGAGVNKGFQMKELRNRDMCPNMLLSTILHFIFKA